MISKCEICIKERANVLAAGQVMCFVFYDNDRINDTHDELIISY